SNCFPPSLGTKIMFSCSHSDSNCTESCKVISMPRLPEELMFVILTFVPLNCLINSARYVSKTWAAIIRSFDFSQARRAHSKHGLYVESCMSGVSSYFLEFKDDDVSGEFEKTDLRKIRNRMGKIMSSCDGILVLSNILREVYVLNPVLKSCLRIPCFPIPMQFMDHSRCQCTRVPRTAQFKLFFGDVLEILGVVWYVFYVLSIGIDNSWKEIARREVSLDQMFLFEPTYSGGNDLLWRTTDEVIVIDVDKEIIVTGYPLPDESWFASNIFMDGESPFLYCCQ
ncbi:hypothetical protein KIW84_046162, partial [Lathyrus oleraceus]